MNNDSLHPQINQYGIWIAMAAFVALFFLWGFLSDESGITGIFSNNDTIIAQTDNDQVFCSMDGGLNWGKCDRAMELYAKATRFPHFQSVEIPDSNTVYQYDENNNIVVSHDGKETWQIIYKRDAAKQVEAYYHSQTRKSFIKTWCAYYDPVSGNALFAVGIDGIVLIDAEENVHKIAVGSYRPGLDFQGAIFSWLLLPYLLISLSSALLIFTVILLFFQYQLNFPILIIQAAIIILSPFSLYLENTRLLSKVLRLAVLLNIEVFIFCIPIMVKVIKRYQIDWQALMLKSLFIGMIYFLPYLLWYFQIIPVYWLAFILSIALMAFLFIKAIQDTTLWKETHKTT